MLADPKAEALATRFAAQYLRLQDLNKIEPDALAFPYFDETLAHAMARETELLFDHLVRADRPLLDMLTADYTFVNERLARHYLIAGVSERIRSSARWRIRTTAAGACWVTRAS